jgi:hypothetical protein
MSAEIKESLLSMGLSAADVDRTLERTKGDIDLALDMLMSGRANSDVDEFDLLAELGEDEQDSRLGENVADPSVRSEPPVQEPADDAAGDDFMNSDVFGARLKTLTEMGFDVKDATAALGANGNDINAALELLASKV